MTNQQYEDAFRKLRPRSKFYCVTKRFVDFHRVFVNVL